MAARIGNRGESGSFRRLSIAEERRLFPSSRLGGKQSGIASMLLEDYLRPAAVKAGIFSLHPNNHRRLVDDDARSIPFS